MTKTSYYKPHEEIQVLEKLLHSGCVYTRDVLQSSQQMEAGLLAWAVTPSFFIMWRAYNPSCHHSTPFCASDVNILFSAGCLLFTCLCAVTGNLILIIKHHKQQILNVLMYLNMSTLTTIFMVQYVPQCAYLVMKWLFDAEEKMGRVLLCLTGSTCFPYIGESGAMEKGYSLKGPKAQSTSASP